MAGAVEPVVERGFGAGDLNAILTVLGDDRQRAVRLGLVDVLGDLERLSTVQDADVMDCFDAFQPDRHDGVLLLQRWKSHVFT